MEIFLKPSVKLEPYIYNWYAWPHLVAPHTAAANIAKRHLAIMKSYLDSPELHQLAVKDPKMIGGPFMDLDIERIEEVGNLFDHTQEMCKKLIALYSNIIELNLILKSISPGSSLEPLYARIPDGLKGLVELVYDINQHPQFRFIEPLLYDKYYDESGQSIVLSDTAQDFRPFCLSTPYLPDTNKLKLDVPLSSNIIDLISRMRTEPVSVDALFEQLRLKVFDEQKFQSFITHHKPRLSQTNRFNDTNGVRVRYFGHACLLIQTAEIAILVDPVISYDYPNTDGRYTFLDLPDKIDYVLITHNHQDHLMFETLLQLRYKIETIIVPSSNIGFMQDPSIKLILKHIGFDNVVSLNEFEEINIQEGKLISLPFLGEHGDLNIQTKCAFAVFIKDKKFLLAADSNNLDNELYRNIFSKIGHIDVLFLGMECDGAPLSWLYGPLLPETLPYEHDSKRRLSGSNCSKAWSLIEASHCNEVYIYAMGQEAWLKYIMAIEYTEDSAPIIESNALITKCKNANIKAERLYVKNEFIY